MTSLVGGIKGERDIRACVCDLTQPRVDNVTARWPQNSLNFSARIRSFGASPSPENGAPTWERVGQTDRRGEEAADITRTGSDLQEQQPCLVVLPVSADVLVSPQRRCW